MIPKEAKGAKMKVRWKLAKVSRHACFSICFDICFDIQVFRSLRTIISFHKDKGKEHDAFSSVLSDWFILLGHGTIHEVNSIIIKPGNFPSMKLERK